MTGSRVAGHDAQGDIDVYCLESDIEFTTYGSWTVKDRPAQRGAEPDECYVFGEERNPARSHLAIEVEWTHGRIDKLDVRPRRQYQRSERTGTCCASARAEAERLVS